MSRHRHEGCRECELLAMEVLSLELQLLHQTARAFDMRPLTFTSATGETTMIALAPGNSPQFTATPQPVGSVLPAGVVPTWSSSDSGTTVAVDSTGLIATVTINPAATVGESITLTVTATLPDGTTPSGTYTFTVVDGTTGTGTGSTEVTSFGIAQTA